jgi:hypothetical protein
VGTKAGITVGGIAALLLLIGLVVWLLRRRRSGYSSADKIVSSSPDMEQAAYQIEPFEGPPNGKSSQYNVIFGILMYNTLQRLEQEAPQLLITIPF